MGGREGGASKTSSRAACVVGGEGAGLGLWVVGVLGALGAEGGAGHALEASKTSSFLTKTKQWEVGWGRREGVLWVVGAGGAGGAGGGRGRWARIGGL